MRKELLERENRRVRALRAWSDEVCRVLARADISLPEAYVLMRELRAFALRLFPDKGSVFDLVVRPRLRRIVRERFVVEGEQRRDSDGNG